MLWIHDKLYTYFYHFLEQIERRGISIEWVEQAMLDPDEVEYSKSTGRYLYDKFIGEANRWVRVVVDEDEAMIVTAHYVNKKQDNEV